MPQVTLKWPPGRTLEPGPCKTFLPGRASCGNFPLNSRGRRPGPPASLTGMLRSSAPLAANRLCQPFRDETLLTVILLTVIFVSRPRFAHNLAVKGAESDCSKERWSQLAWKKGTFYITRKLQRKANRIKLSGSEVREGSGPDHLRQLHFHRRRFCKPA